MNNSVRISLAVTGLLMLAACAPSTVAPGNVSAIGSAPGTSSAIFLPSPLSARVSSPDRTGLGWRADSVGPGFEVVNGAWGLEIKVPPRPGVAMRGSFVSDGLAVGLNLGWETYETWAYSGPPNYSSQTVSSGGFGVDLGYYFPIALETARGYVGPRLYTYVLCESLNNAPLACVGPRLNPGATIGVNLRLWDRLTVSPEITALLLPPDARYANPRGVTVFGVSFSYRF